MSVLYGSGILGGGTTVVTRDLYINYTLYCECMKTSGCNQGAAAEVDAIKEQQLKLTK